MNKLDRLMEQEVNRMVNRLNLSNHNDVKNVLTELFSMTTNKLMDSIGSVEANEHNQIAKENWDLFIQHLTSSIQEEQELWFKNISEVKLKILTHKYFTKQDMMKVENIDGYLRMEIKPYFTALQNFIDYTDFRHKVLTLPTDLLYNLIRYMFYVSPALGKAAVVKNADLKDNINRLLGVRMSVVEKINKISKGYQNLFDFRELKELFDCGVVFEDNYLNRAICEFVVKMTNHGPAAEKLRDLYPGAILKDLKNQAENTSSYIQHVTAIKSETGVEFFTKNGEQIGTRLENEIELVKGAQYDGYVVDNNSRLKEPHDKVKPVAAENIPSSAAPSDGGDAESGGGPGGGGFGGGPSGGGALGMDLGNADFGGEFAPEGAEGEVPGAEDEAGVDDTGAVGAEEDGEPMPVGEDGVPTEFGTEEDNTPDAAPASPEENPKEEGKQDGTK